ncbi:MAG: FAD-dependent oxidoreductase, partial [Comamonadaceae bacterium]
AFDALARRGPTPNTIHPQRLLTAAEATQVEPALASLGAALAGATLSMGAPSGDASAFAAEMVFLCRAAGVRFLTQHTVVALHEGEGRIDHVEVIDHHGERRCMRAAAYVLALGNSSLRYVNEIGQELPLTFQRHYGIDVPVRSDATAPQITLYDNAGHMRLRPTVKDGRTTRLTLSVSVPVTALERHDGDPARFDAMLCRVEQLLRGVVDADQARFHTRLQAISANGLPLIGRTRLPNLFVNTAPGSLGWVNACGAGKSIARIVSGLRPELEFAFTGL